MTNPYLAIVPALNEVGMIAQTVGELHRWVPGLRRPGRGRRLNRRHGGRSRSRRRRGPPASRSIWESAEPCRRAICTRESVTIEVAVQVDGDGQHDPREIPRLLARLAGRGGQYGHRVPVPGASRRRLSLVGQRAGPGSASSPRVVSLASRQRVTDPTSGFRMIDRRGIELFARDYPHDYPEVEAILLMHSNRLRVLRGPGADAPRTTGRSAISRGQAGVLHGQGPAGGIRGAVPPPLGRSWRGTSLRWSPSARCDLNLRA